MNNADYSILELKNHLEGRETTISTFKEFSNYFPLKLTRLKSFLEFLFPENSSYLSSYKYFTNTKEYFFNEIIRQNKLDTELKKNEMNMFLNLKCVNFSRRYLHSKNTLEEYINSVLNREKSRVENSDDSSRITSTPYPGIGSNSNFTKSEAKKSISKIFNELQHAMSMQSIDSFGEACKALNFGPVRFKKLLKYLFPKEDYNTSFRHFLNTEAAFLLKLESYHISPNDSEKDALKEALKIALNVEIHCKQIAIAGSFRKFIQEYVQFNPGSTANANMLPDQGNAGDEFDFSEIVDWDPNVFLNDLGTQNVNSNVLPSPRNTVVDSYSLMRAILFPRNTETTSHNIETTPQPDKILVPISQHKNFNKDPEIAKYTQNFMLTKR